MWQAHKTITFNKQLEFKRNLQKNLLSTFAVLGGSANMESFCSAAAA